MGERVHTRARDANTRRRHRQHRNRRRKPASQHIPAVAVAVPGVGGDQLRPVGDRTAPTRRVSRSHRRPHRREPRLSRVSHHPRSGQRGRQDRTGWQPIKRYFDVWLSTGTGGAPKSTRTTRCSWVCGHELLYDLDAQHEVFILLEDAVPFANAGQVQALLEHVAAGPPTDDDEDPSPYRRYNLLAWLARVAPASEPIQEAFAADQVAHPEFESREHLDLNMYMTETSFDDEGDPLGRAAHAMIASDARRAWGRIRSSPPGPGHVQSRRRQLGSRAQSVRACVTAYPDDGLRLSEVLNDTGETAESIKAASSARPCTKP